MKDIENPWKVNEYGKTRKEMRKTAAPLKRRGRIIPSKLRSSIKVKDERRTLNHYEVINAHHPLILKQSLPGGLNHSHLSGKDSIKKKKNPVATVFLTMK